MTSLIQDSAGKWSAGRVCLLAIVLTILVVNGVHALRLNEDINLPLNDVLAMVGMLLAHGYSKGNDPDPDPTAIAPKP